MTNVSWGWIATCDNCPREIHPDDNLCNHCNVQAATDRSDDDLRTDGGEQLGDEAEHRPIQHAEVSDDE